MKPPICRHLRTKKMYMDSMADAAFEEKPSEHASPCHFWCGRTQTEKGVDDRLAHKDHCGPGRSCYKE